MRKRPRPDVTGRSVLATASFRLGKRTFRPGELAVMAIVNRTPDSFFDRGATFAEDAALRAVDTAVRDGAEIIDIGGVKAGPGDEVGLDLPVDQRLEGTLAETAVSAWLGARVFRAHHVRETRRVLDMVATIRGDRPPAVARRGLV